MPAPPRASVEPLSADRHLLKVTLGAPVVAKLREALKLLAEGRADLFAALHDTNLLPDHNRMEFYTWGDADCRLPAGATWFAPFRAGCNSVSPSGGQSCMTRM